MVLRMPVWRLWTRVQSFSQKKGVGHLVPRPFFIAEGAGLSLIAARVRGVAIYQHGLGSVAGAECSKNCRHMGLHGGLCDAHFKGDLFVQQTIRKAGNDPLLGRRQAAEIDGRVR